MPFFTDTAIKPLNLLFCISTFYKEKTKEMFANSLNSLFESHLKTFNPSKVSIVEFSEGFVSIFLGNAKEMLKKDSHQIQVVSVAELPKIISNIALDKRFSFFSLKDLQNNEILKFASISVNGSLEIPQVASFFLNKHKDIDGVIALGIIKKGATDHNHYVATECMRGIGKVSLKYSIPFANGIITADTDKLIEDRISASGQNIGKATVQTCLDIIFLKRKMETIF
jgi:6,7-dimethyl-8-ribityllumazine synthase